MAAILQVQLVGGGICLSVVASGGGHPQSSDLHFGFEGDASRSLPFRHEGVWGEGLLVLILRLPLATPSDWQPDQRQGSVPGHSASVCIPGHSSVTHRACALWGKWQDYPFLHFQVPPWGCLARIPQSMFDAATPMSSARPRTWYVVHFSPTLSRSLGEPLPPSPNPPLRLKLGFRMQGGGLPSHSEGLHGGASAFSASRAAFVP